MDPTRSEPLQSSQSRPRSPAKREKNHHKEDEEYRLRVYGTQDIHSDREQHGPNNNARRTSLRRSLSRQLSQSKPETPTGWAVLLSAVSTAFLGYELRLQKSLTCPPLVFGQRDGPLQDIYEALTATPESILARHIQPSLFVGTRAVLSSTAAYTLGGPSETKQHVRFRQILTMTQDGARVAIDWELPPLDENSSLTEQQQKNEILNGPIEKPVVLILHGINNDSSFGYIRSFQRTCTDRGWIAAALNFRGCGGVSLSTPRGYNGAYTGDLRCVVHHLEGKMADGVPVFLVGNSLGANLVTKYLGEEGLSGTLPSCVAAGVALGNPLSINSTKAGMVSSPLLALGAKKNILENWRALRQMNSPDVQKAIRKALMAVTLAEFDRALAPIFPRNDPVAPFQFRIGFKSGQAYWTDASSYRLVRYISVPTLQIIAGDDFLVFPPFRGRLSYNLANPNVMVVETKCGGHLGWHEAPPDGNAFGAGTSWSNVATADFIQAAIVSHAKKRTSGETTTWPEGNTIGDVLLDDSSKIRSRL